MSFEFMYGCEWYKYENGWIHRNTCCDSYDRVCPVLFDLTENLESFPAEQLNNTMCAILHGYYHGFAAGQAEKIKEFKRVFKID